MVFLVKIAIFRPYIELEAIARQTIEASREVIYAYFGNIGRNSGYFLLPIFLDSYLIDHRVKQHKIRTTGINRCLMRRMPGSLG